MASVPLEQQSAPAHAPSGVAPALLRTVSASGSLAHPYVSSEALRSGPHAARNQADAIHMLCSLHGRYPSLIELVASRNVEPSARAWLHEVGEAFAGERTYLARLSVEAGPIPATPGAGSEATVAMQRNALATLAQSERRGCPLGAAFAMALDWSAIRAVLDGAANRFGRAIPHRYADQSLAVTALVETLSADSPVARAVRFGAEQVALQHRGMWDLLRARAEARGL